jgi:hypothetical protein
MPGGRPCSFICRWLYLCLSLNLLEVRCASGMLSFINREKNMPPVSLSSVATLLDEGTKKGAGCSEKKEKVSTEPQDSLLT